MNRELSLEFVRVTEAAAIACGHLVGRGDKNGADGLAVDAMRAAFDTVNIKGTVVIGEGEMDEAPMLYIGEEVGAGGLRLISLLTRLKVPTWLLKDKTALSQLLLSLRVAACCMLLICTWIKLLSAPVLKAASISMLRSAKTWHALLKQWTVK